MLWNHPKIVWKSSPTFRVHPNSSTPLLFRVSSKQLRLELVLCSPWTRSIFLSNYLKPDRLFRPQTTKKNGQSIVNTHQIRNVFLLSETTDKGNAPSDWLQVWKCCFASPGPASWHNNHTIQWAKEFGGLFHLHSASLFSNPESFSHQSS